MKIQGFDGKIYNLKFGKPKPNCSTFHIKARDLLKKTFPFDSIYEETLLLGSKRFNRPNLRADFFIPSRKILVEVHGEQHYTYKSHFHKNRLSFLEHKSRDLRKIDWCNLNNIIYIEFPYNESESEWLCRIENI